MFLGYQWQDQVSILSSRLTLLFGKEIKLSFLTDAEVYAKGKYDTEIKNYSIQGFCLSSGSSHADKREKVKELIKDLDCIHLNEHYNYELAFAVCAYPSVMQAWYDMMREGIICTNLIKRVGGIDALSKMYTEGRENEIEILKDEIRQITPSFTVTK